ncbi:chemotaxis protein CheB [Pseudonocardia sp. RS11V-5]|uniref:chemotaxis protein CheB n=1 Tax=Pseudonocardia terrae TaxID=2905831 RepID=UPI001E5EE3F8|nr:chemotaxis protein CheB [Pseudonocardia terrae]MCE3553121.1 chemotaxis protein CheB [Pseudonocardia terrae]
MTVTAGSGTFRTPVGSPRRIVVLACSAGGLDALSRVLQPLPADLPAAVVVVQHQRPEQGSLLAPILARRCRLPVHDVHHGEQLREGHVYVVPPGRHALATTAGTLALISTDGPPPYRPSADLLLTSLAVTAGPRTTAVILSGGGRDGATGAVAVHDFGGTVLAADEASSAHFAMPAAAIARDDAVDRVLPVDDIAAALVASLGHGDSPPTTAGPVTGPVGRGGG